MSRLIIALGKVPLAGATERQDIKNISWQGCGLVIIASDFELSNDEVSYLNQMTGVHDVPMLLYMTGLGVSNRVLTLRVMGVVHKDDDSALIASTVQSLLVYGERMRTYKADSELLGYFLKYNHSYVFFKDEEARVLKLSDNYSKMLGIPVSEAIGKNMMEIFPSELAKSMVEDDLQILREGKVVEVVETLHGRYYKTSKFPIIRQNQKPILAGFTIDISDLKETEIKLAEAMKSVEAQSVTDYLLGIRNRRGFIENLSLEIERSIRYGNASSLMLLDIDNLKQLNDSLGHFKADQFLHAFVGHVKHHTRANDIFGRIGGDEFGLVCVSTPIKEAVEIAKRILTTVRETPVIIDGQAYFFTVSIGMVEINNQDQEMSELLHKADLALYAVKTTGRNNIKVYNDVEMKA